MEMENMDLSNLSTTINENVSNEKNDDSKTSTPKKPFPSDVLKWMKKNATPKMAFKLMQVCKYFQREEFPYFAIKSLASINEFLPYTDLYGAKSVWENIEAIPDNLWITDEILIHTLDESNYLSQLIPKIGVCEVKQLIFGKQEIFFNDFKALTSSGTVKHLFCNDTYIRDESEEIAPFEDILDCLPNIENIFFRRGAPSFSTAAAAKKEWILPHLKNLEFRYIDEDFDAAKFIEFMKNHKTVKFILCFLHSAFFEYAQPLQAFVDEIIAAADLQYPPPHLAFPFQNVQSKAALEALEKAFTEK